MRTRSRTPFLAKLLVAGSGIMSLANSVTIPFLAIFLRRELSLEPAAVGLVIGSSVFFSIAAGFFGGTLSDLFGRVPVLLAGLAGVVLSFAGFAVAGHLAAVIAANAALALSSSVFAPVSKALLGDLLPEGTRVRWFSHQYLATNAGYAVGPLLGVALGLSGARIAFIAAAIVYGLYLAALAAAVRRTPAVPTPAKADDQTAADRFLGSLRAVATDPRLLCLLFAGLLLESVQLRISALLAQDLDIDFDNGTQILAAVMTANAVTVVAFQLLAARYVLRLEPVTAITAGALLLFAGMAGFAFSTTLWHFVAAMAVFSLGEVFIVPSEFALIDRIAPPAARGTYFGAQSFTQLGAFTGPLIGGLLLAEWGGTVMYLGVGALALAAAAVYLAAGRRTPSLARATAAGNGQAGDGSPRGLLRGHGEGDGMVGDPVAVGAGGAAQDPRDLVGQFGRVLRERRETRDERGRQLRRQPHGRDAAGEVHQGRFTVTQGPAGHFGDHGDHLDVRDRLGGEDRLASQEVVLEQCVSGDFGDVAGVDDRFGEIGVRPFDRVAEAKLVAPQR
jgi:MFS family permease